MTYLYTYIYIVIYRSINELFYIIYSDIRVLPISNLYSNLLAIDLY